MSSIITITVYTLDELSCPARGKARDWYRQHHADSNWYENVYEDFREVCGIFGIDLRQRVFRLSNGRFMEEPCIWFSGFCSQGDGACFEGRWHWQPATPRKIREYAPQDRELHRMLWKSRASGSADSAARGTEPVLKGAGTGSQRHPGKSGNMPLRTVSFIVSRIPCRRCRNVTSGSFRLKSVTGDVTAIRTAWISPSPGTVRLVRQ